MGENDQIGWLASSVAHTLPPLNYRFHNTHHVLLRQDQREFSLESVKAVLTYPQNKEQIGTGFHGGKRWKLKKTVDGSTLVVVAEIKNNECWLITAFYET